MIEAIITSKSRRLLIKYLFTSTNPQEDYALMLSKRLGISYMPIQRELSSLEKGGLVISRRIGKTVIFEVNKDYPLYKELRALIMKVESLEKVAMPAEIRKAIDELIKALSSESDVFLFGSRASDKLKRTSDWDIGFYQETPIALYELLALKQRIRECAWPYRVDVVDFSKVTGEFKKLASKNVLYIKRGAKQKWMKS